MSGPVELTPCPFCGGSDLFVDTIDGTLPPQTGLSVSCEDCTARASYGDWNTRAQPDAVAKLVEAAKDFLAKCNSAWAAGEPSHRVEAMLAAADRLDTALANLAGEGA